MDIPYMFHIYQECVGWESVKARLTLLVS